MGREHSALNELMPPPIMDSSNSSSSVLESGSFKQLEAQACSDFYEMKNETMRKYSWCSNQAFIYLWTTTYMGGFCLLELLNSN